MTHTLHLKISGGCGECSSGEEIDELHDDEPVITRWYVQTVITRAQSFENDVYRRDAELDEDICMLRLRDNISLYISVLLRSA